MSIVYHYVCNIFLIYKRPLKAINLRSNGGGWERWIEARKTQHCKTLSQTADVHTVKRHPILALTFSESQPCFAYSLGDFLILLSVSCTLLTEPLLPLVIRKQMSVIGDEPLGVTEVSRIVADLSRSADGTRDISHAT